MPRIFPIFDEIDKAVTPMGRGGGPAPQNVTAVPQGNNIYLSWDPLPGAVNYIVYRNVSPDLATATVIATPTGTSYTDMGAMGGMAGMAYYYWIAASPGPGYPDSDATGPVTATPPSTLPSEPPPPTEPPPEIPAEPVPEPPSEPPEPPITPEPEPGFVPGQNLRRISEIVRRRLEEIQKEKAAGRWPPWGYH